MIYEARAWPGAVKLQNLSDIELSRVSSAQEESETDLDFEFISQRSSRRRFTQTLNQRALIVCLDARDTAQTNF